MQLLGRERVTLGVWVLLLLLVVVVAVLVKEVYSRG
jgi:hypothetical protein